MQAVTKQSDTITSLLADTPLRTSLVVIVLILIVKRVWNIFRKNPRHVKLSNTLPGPPTRPLLGNSLEFSDEKVGLLKTLAEYEKKYGSTYRLWFGKNLVVATSDLDFINTIFQSSKTLDKPHFFEPAGIQFWGNQNVFIAPTPLWKKTRKGMQPFFTKSSLVTSMPRVNRLVRKYTHKMKKCADGSQFNIGHVLNMLSFEIMVEVVLNASLDCPEKDLESLSACFEDAEMIISDKILKPWLCTAVADLLFYRKSVNKFKNELNNFYSKVQNRQIISEEDKTSESPLIHLLHRIKEDLGLAEDYVKLESLHMIGAASITTAHVASFCFLMVAMHPDVQDKLYAEITGTLGGEDRDLDVDEMNNLPYLDQVLKETGRRFLHDPIMFRSVTEDMPYGPHIIPAGSSVMIASSAIHMSTKYYKTPEKFDPEHFNSEANSERPKLAFFPFSAGARNCPGKALAEAGLKLMVIKLLQSFEFSTTEKMENLEVIPGFRTFLEEYGVSARRRDE